MYFCETLHFWNNIFLLVSLVLSELHYQSIPNVIRYGKIGVHFFCCFLEICPSNFVFDFFLKVFCYIVADSLLYICALCCFCCLLMLQSIFVQRNFFRLQAMWIFILPLQLVKTKGGVKWPGQASAGESVLQFGMGGRGISHEFLLTIRPMMVSWGNKALHSQVCPW